MISSVAHPDPLSARLLLCENFWKRFIARENLLSYDLLLHSVSQARGQSWGKNPAPTPGRQRHYLPVTDRHTHACMHTHTHLAPGTDAFKSTLIHCMVRPKQRMK